MKKIIIKVGSSSLVDANNQLYRPQILELVRQICSLREQGIQVVLVSSGAIASAHGVLPSPPATSLPTKQMLASIGQVRLMQTWGELFQIYAVLIGQVLLTHEDFADPKRSENAKNTLQALLDHQIIPIINENDTVSTEEITFGDNDKLAAYVAELTQADHLILLTDQQGLYTADPRFHAEAELIKSIDTIDQSILSCASESLHSSSVGTGGMNSKVHAAKLATQNGTRVTIGSAKEPDILLKLASGAQVGTTFNLK
ncbi:MAG: Glutamate 5-kinase [Chlamydiales bacterium]|nr:Glutamate 5-kinase [Chlamydiales bacterium]